MKQLVLASRNRHKLAEIRRILHLPGVEWLGLQEFADIPEVVEDGQTFIANAVKKAVTTALHCRHWVIADDSGLEVQALAGAPGVLSARYAGEPSNDTANNARLLRELAGNPDRAARFCCVVALATPDGRAQIVEGVCAGLIITEPRGTRGFGYDPLFVPNGYDLTFAEMGGDVKNQISHRALALKSAAKKWRQLLSG